MEKDYFIKIFADIAVYLDIVPDGVLEFVSNKFGDDIKKKADFSGMTVSSIYLMLDIEGGCQAKCAFCVQSSSSDSERRNSTLVDNPIIRYPLKVFTEKIKNGLLERKKIERICIQTIYHEETVISLMKVVKALQSVTNVPLTACCIPVERQALLELKSAGLDMVTINYETATQELFHQVRGEGCGGPYRWDTVTEAIDNSVEIFGKEKVGSHLQLGFGETAKEALYHIQGLYNKGVIVSLFAFQPLKDTKLQNSDRISHQNFHKIQLGSYLIQHGVKQVEDFEFDHNGGIVKYGLSERELSDQIESGVPFRNKGCPGCNRIYYETNPNERFFTYPRALTGDEVYRIKAEIMS